MKAVIIDVDIKMFNDKVWLELELIDEYGWNFIQYFNDIYKVMKFFKISDIKQLRKRSVKLIDGRNRFVVPFGFLKDGKSLYNDNSERLDYDN